MASLAQNLKTAFADPEVFARYVRWRLAGLSGGERVLAIEEARISGFPNFSSYLGAWRNRITAEEKAFLSTQIPTGGVVFDVGANWGVFSIFMAELVGDAGSVYAFEPVPSTFTGLDANLKRNAKSQVTSVNSAVGAEPGEVRFTNSRDPATNRIDAQGQLSIPLISLDAFCEENGMSHIDFLKVDVEGAELGVIEGAEKLFQSSAIRSGIIEICPGNLKMFGATLADLHDAFAKVNYVMYWLDQPNKVLSPDDLSGLPDNFLSNAGFRSAG